MNINDIITNVLNFNKVSNTILKTVESSSARVVTIEESYKQLSNLSIKQDDLFRQSIRCIENGLYRAAHVMAWAAFIDYFHEKLSEDGFIKLQLVRQNWRLSDIGDLREQSDYHVIEAAKEMKYLSRTEQKALHGLLNRRNECAHPEDYFPGLNESLGYLSELIKRINTFQSRPL